MVGVIVEQLKKPSGWVGKRLVGPFLNVFHAPLHELYLDAIDVQTDDHILEVGFGTGRLLARMAASASSGVVSGGDHSNDMLLEAQRKTGILGVAFLLYVRPLCANERTYMPLFQSGCLRQDRQNIQRTGVGTSNTYTDGTFAYTNK